MNKRVLLIDGHEHFIKSFRRQLNARNFEIVGEANNCQQALELFKSESPDLTLLDFELLTTGGIEILQKILSLDPDALVIMLSGKCDIATIQQCLDEGAYHFLRKDYPLETIFSVIEESMNRYTGMES